MSHVHIVIAIATANQKSHPTCTGPTEAQLLDIILIKPFEAEGKEGGEAGPSSLLAEEDDLERVVAFIQR